MLYTNIEFFINFLLLVFNKYLKFWFLSGLTLIVQIIVYLKLWQFKFKIEQKIILKIENMPHNFETSSTALSSNSETVLPLLQKFFSLDQIGQCFTKCENYFMILWISSYTIKSLIHSLYNNLCQYLSGFSHRKSFFLIASG